MKLATNTVEVQSNMEFDEVVKVGIADDDEAVALVIERLISAYKNPYRAALREYTSNAYDEHVEAGVSRAVEVSLPTDLSPVLKVQDFGRGLTRDELKGYGTIGKSSKRDSNDTTGGFGMGSKCALAAAPQFTVTSVKDGKRNTVVVARDANNVPHMNFLAEQETDDETGTTVIIPISDVQKFGDLKNFWVGWKPGTILVDDEQPKVSVYDPTLYREVRGGIGWYDLSNTPSGRDDIRIMINQVYYELEYKDLGLDYKQWNILKYYVVKLDNGSVEIAPSRETLLYNARTNAAVKERMETILSLSARDHAAAVTAAPDIKTALTLLEKMKSNGYPTDGIRFGRSGIALPGQIIKGNRVPNAEGTWATAYKDYQVKSGWRVEKEFGQLSRQRIWMNTNQRKFVIVHTANVPTSYGKYGSRQAHREAFGVGEYLSTVQDSRDFGWDVFITTEPLKMVNRHYRDMADVILSADDFNAVVKVVRAELAKEAKLANEAKKASQKLRVVVFNQYGNGGSYVHEYTAGDIKAEFDYAVFLRNQAGGFEQSMRDSLVTKANNNNSWNKGIQRIQRKFKVAIILINKNDKVEDLKSVLPPFTTLQDLAVKGIQETNTTTTKWDRMAIRDREKYTVDVIRILKDEHLAKIKNKTTVNWAKSVRDFTDMGAGLRAEYEWMSYYVPEVKDALRVAQAGGDTTGLPESPIKRYPLLQAVYAHSASPTDVVDYINLREKSLKKA